MDPILEDYHAYLIGKYPDKNFPEFCDRHSGSAAAKTVLAVLPNPGRYGAAAPVRCSIDNDEPVFMELRRIGIDAAGLDPQEVLFWHFYPYAGWYRTQSEPADQIAWAAELGILAGRLTNLRAVAVCGTAAWTGMRHFRFPRGVAAVWTPLPSKYGVLDPAARALCLERWRYVRELARGG